jgi:hypothetical protein
MLGEELLMHLKRTIQFTMLFLILIGSLSISAGPHAANQTEQSSVADSLNLLENQPIEQSASLAEQGLEVNQLVWSHIYSTPEDAWGRKVVACENDDFCLLGVLSQAGQAETILMRVDSLGNQLWNRTFHYANDTTGNSLILCSDGGFAIVGRISNRTPGGYDRGWLMKTNSTGHEQWNMTFSGLIDGFGGFTDLIQTSDGGFVLVGTDISSSLTDDDIVVAKTDENGTILWDEYYYTYGEERGGSIVQCASGGYAISGLAQDSTGWHTVLMRIDNSSTHRALWYETFPSDGTTPPLIECNNGDFLVGCSYTILRTNGDGVLKEVIDFPIRAIDAAMLDASYLVITGDNTLVIRDMNTSSTLSISLGFVTSSLARCSNGEFVVAGYVPFDITAVRVPWLEWNETVSDVLVEYATPLSIDFNATCSQGIGPWSVNDTGHFSIDSQGLLTNVSVLEVGEYPLEIVVTDNLGNQLIQRFTVTVEDTTPPTWLQVPGTVIAEAGQPFSYTLHATDASGTLTWSVSSEYGFTINQAGVITNTMPLTVNAATPLTDGIYPIEVSVQDASGNVLTGTLTVDVKDHQVPIYIVPPPSLVVPYGQVIEFDVVAYDFSGFSTWMGGTSDFIMLAENNGQYSIIHFTSNGILPPGVYEIPLAIFDWYLCSQQDLIRVTITETDAPVWTQAPVTQHVEYGQAFSYDLNATDSSGIDSWWLGDDTYFSIDSNGLIIERAPLEVGFYAFSAFVNDTLGNTLSCSILVQVSDTTAPVWVSPPMNQAISQDQPLDYQLFASDLSGISTWHVNDTAHFSIDSEGHLRNIVGLAPGVYWVNISVSDIYGNELSASISITVSSSSTTTTTTTTTTTPPPTTTTTTTSPTTEGVLDSMQILLLGLGSGIGGAALVIIIYLIMKRR